MFSMVSSSGQSSFFSWLGAALILLGTVALFVAFRYFLDGRGPARQIFNQNSQASPVQGELRDTELKRVDEWLSQQRLDQYGNPEGTFYAGGTPLFDERTGERIDRLEYLKLKFPNEPWLE